MSWATIHYMTHDAWTYGYCRSVESHIRGQELLPLPKRRQVAQTHVSIDLAICLTSQLRVFHPSELGSETEIYVVGIYMLGTTPFEYIQLNR